MAPVPRTIPLDAFNSMSIVACGLYYYVVVVKIIARCGVLLCTMYAASVNSIQYKKTLRRVERSVQGAAGRHGCIASIARRPRLAASSAALSKASAVQRASRKE